MKRKFSATSSSTLLTLPRDALAHILDFVTRRIIYINERNPEWHNLCQVHPSLHFRNWVNEICVCIDEHFNTNCMDKLIPQCEYLQSLQICYPEDDDVKQVKMIAPILYVPKRLGSLWVEMPFMIQLELENQLTDLWFTNVDPRFLQVLRFPHLRICSLSDFTHDEFQSLSLHFAPVLQELHLFNLNSLERIVHLPKTLTTMTLMCDNLIMNQWPQSVHTLVLYPHPSTGWKLLSTISKCTYLQDLEVDWIESSSTEISHLAHLRYLRRISLSTGQRDTNVETEPIEKLLCKNAKSLEQLQLDGPWYFRYPMFPNLKHLDIHIDNVAAISTLCSCLNPLHMTYLSIKSHDESKVSLNCLGAFINLTFLKLYHIQFTFIPYFPKLDRLGIYWISQTDKYTFRLGELRVLVGKGAKFLWDIAEIYVRRKVMELIEQLLSNVKTVEAIQYREKLLAMCLNYPLP